MKAPTLEEIDFMKSMARTLELEKDMMYLFKDEKGFTYVSSDGIPKNPSDIPFEQKVFSRKARRIIDNFEVPQQNTTQGDFFTLDLMNAYISEMVQILVSEGSDSPKFRRIPKRERIIRNVQTPLTSWDPSKGKEIQTFAERRVYSTKTRVAFVLQHR